MSIDLTGPFRGSVAVAQGAITWGVLRGRRFHRLLPDIYAPAELPRDFELMSRAVGVLIEGRGVVAGYSAAELLGASCARPDAEPDVLLRAAGNQAYHCDGVRVRRDVVADRELVTVGSITMTSPLRTAFDLARWAPDLTEKVVAVDALAYRCRFDPARVWELKQRHPGAHHSRDLHQVLRLADRRAESPMESRIRIPLVLSGLPTPHVQHPVQADGHCFRLDLAYPEVKLAIEYDGPEHRTPERARQDLAREALLTALGWTILRFDAYAVLAYPDLIVAEVEARLRARGFVW